MLTPVPYSPVHMEFCAFHPQFADAASREDPEMLAKVSREAWALLDEGGQVVAIIGAVETHSRCAYLWSFMSESAGRHAVGLTRFMLRWLPLLDCIRLETTVMKDFRAGHRWMRLLGFKKETTRPMKRWDGVSDFHLYARIAR